MSFWISEFLEVGALKHPTVALLPMFGLSSGQINMVFSARENGTHSYLTTPFGSTMQLQIPIKVGQRIGMFWVNNNLCGNSEVLVGPQVFEYHSKWDSTEV